MASNRELEDRIAALEKQVTALSARLSQPRKVRENWLTSRIGIMADFPEFEEVIRLGKEWRDSFKPEIDEADTRKKPANAGKKIGLAKPRRGTSKKLGVNRS